MSVNPFEDPAADYSVLCNERGQHSLWPVFAPVPAGWHTRLEHGSRTQCLKYIEESWQDIRPTASVKSAARTDAE